MSDSTSSTPPTATQQSTTTFPSPTEEPFSDFEEIEAQEPKKKSKKGFLAALIFTLLIIAIIYVFPRIDYPPTENEQIHDGLSCLGNAFHLLKYLPFGMFALFGISEFFAVLNKRLRSGSFFPLFLTTAVSFFTLMSGYCYIKSNGLDLSSFQPYFILASHFTAALVALTFFKYYQTRAGKGAILLPYALVFLASIGLMLFAAHHGLKHLKNGNYNLLPWETPAWLTSGQHSCESSEEDTEPTSTEPTSTESIAIPPIVIPRVTENNMATSATTEAPSEGITTEPTPAAQEAPATNQAVGVKEATTENADAPETETPKEADAQEAAAKGTLTNKQKRQQANQKKREQQEAAKAKAEAKAADEKAKAAAADEKAKAAADAKAAAEAKAEAKKAAIEAELKRLREQMEELQNTE